ncbi:alpha/beta-hydrolase [Periconia macrospinosa]|uniref:Alpha/beta-hydrolase n=1 Tax=Periconia macrospinosa TaxID=97972 RepID=A0A2V1D1M4_9PLEO|nr:alpha/beta-hydrolase [Periconia macrospinosa]
MDPEMQTAIRSFQRSVYDKSFTTISEQQARTAAHKPAPPDAWVAEATFTVPSHGSSIADVVYAAIEALGEGNEELGPPASLCDIKGEWIAPRRKADATLADASPEDVVKKIAAHSPDKPTIFYIHGGAFYMGSPASVRPAPIALAQFASGRCFSLQYRLAPQNQFPAAILDVFLAYLSLLYPPPGAAHDAVPAANIVLSGESSGGNLALALMQVIGYLHRVQGGKCPVIRHDGRDVEVPYPAGCAVLGLLGDNTHCLPSYTANAKLDVLADPQPLLRESFPPCPAWPTNPPRGDIYCHTSAMRHPLVSPVAAKTWEGSPPMWFACGQEQMVDDSSFIAQEAARQGVSVQWTEYAGMPHLFAFRFPMFPQSMHVFKSWADFIRVCVARQKTENRAIKVRLDLDEEELQVDQILSVTRDEMELRMRQKQSQRKIYTGKMSVQSNI